MNYFANESQLPDHQGHVWPKTEYNGAQVPFQVIHLHLAEIKKRGEGFSKTEAFLIVIDESTRKAAAKPEKEHDNSLLALLQRNIFKNIKVVFSDNGQYSAVRSPNNGPVKDELTVGVPLPTTQKEAFYLTASFGT